MSDHTTTEEQIHTPEELAAAARAQPTEGSPGAYRDRTRDVFVVERPWGRFEQFATNETVTVKTVTIDPGQRLSLQHHAARNEMWQVLDHPVDVTLGDRTWSAQPGELVWVPVGTLHRMGNSGDQPARVLELAFGDFDEADITRVEDDYRRD
ncbi:phosphomannose isomerase type II C-terminal cupin domain [Ornithinimicrobium sp. F0845]|uniref:phosphomannose isomerase type II C-terminal cupin domain n=1 Tax=Ornithinimicrobium sp. F0845 TaxID=2926412 RepID=UPI001FF1F916|nr:phosphomannose isomerase type II C-terminal cupin domain [Ornithinimicrobium sp. F0845]MCK0110783.1 phosphomannose isomerase type II C-terminal cupin domain [Ornithinimicrobium sp. F0845]